MTMLMGNLFSEFAWNLDGTMGFIDSALKKEDEIKAEFAARGVSTLELAEAYDALTKIANVFYNTSQPV